MKRTFWLCVGLMSLTLGFLGVFLPLLPTTPFVLLAVFCFARSSQRLHRWLIDHPRFGPAIRNWHENRAIDRKSKRLAIGSMLVVLATSLAFGVPTNILIVQILVLGAVATFILTRPS